MKLPIGTILKDHAIKNTYWMYMIVENKSAPLYRVLDLPSPALTNYSPGVIITVAITQTDLDRGTWKIVRGKR